MCPSQISPRRRPIRSRAPWGLVVGADCLPSGLRILARLTTALSPNTPVECSIDVFIEPTNDAPTITPSPNVPVSISLSGPLPYVEIVGFTVADIDVQPDLCRARTASQTDPPALPALHCCQGCPHPTCRCRWTSRTS
ncbi:unnamed protein product [Vitrella brassicaformis CCMP3155]|uniref:Uncharacterized protein n=1 Tax=Vitrella brassicaformis (strain CCMP3155) TaxID=1169540 RepID=A0A0G4H3I3_VITBC|nr:unnamed protein product [Vitrella brassicaformis CCMP3155]|eukprot:CEM38264.1 unnamed protein product [Vitrella brassicaformis CCMP3155]